MILFFDRSVGIHIPIALRDHLTPPSLQVEYHDDIFEPGAKDDTWLPEVGKREWIVIGQDHHYHLRSPEIEAIIEYRVGAFYLWGAEATRWESMRCFAKAYDKILHRAVSTPKPFVYRIEKSGALNELYVL